MATRGGSGPLATGVGSLPHVDAAAAVALVGRVCPRLPFWPQLPARDAREGMVEQVLGPWRDGLVADGWRRRWRGGAVGDVEAPLTADEAAGWYGLREWLERAGAPVMVKGQLVGPLTLAAAVDGTIEPAALLARLVAVARGMLLDGVPMLVVVDEPLLGEADDVGMLRELLSAIASMGAVAGLHCCGRWPASLDVGAGALSWDAALGGPDDPGDGWLMPGLVATADGAVSAWGGPPSRTIVTPACGLAGLSEAEAEARLVAAVEVAEELPG